MGQIYYDMGFLASSEVVETSATDLVGQYVGQTGPKTQQVLERGLGKVLFIDEAYRLAEGNFAQEAMDEIVDAITKPKFAQKLIIILAGYDADIERLLQVNAGLRSRFSGSVQFDSLSSVDCIQLMYKLFLKEKTDLSSNSQAQFDIVCLESPDAEFMRAMMQRFEKLACTAGWANARDVETLKKTIFGKVLQTSRGRKLVLSKDAVLEALDAMINERSSGETRLQGPLTTGGGSGDQKDLPVRTQTNIMPETRSKSESSVNIDVTPEKPDTSIKSDTSKASTTTTRDDGVTDEVWHQLEKDKAQADAREREYLRSEEEKDRQEKVILKLIEEEEKAARELENAKMKADEDAKRQHEQARLQLELERRRQEAVLEKLRKQQEALAEARRKEQANQRKLKNMGVCVAGFQWVKQSYGYRCAGGTHFVSNAQLENC